MENINVYIGGEKRNNSYRQILVKNNKLAIQFQSGKIYYGINDDIKIKPEKEISIISNDLLFIGFKPYPNVKKMFQITENIFRFVEDGVNYYSYKSDFHFERASEVEEITNELEITIKNKVEMNVYRVCTYLEYVVLYLENGERKILPKSSVQINIKKIGPVKKLLEYFEEVARMKDAEGNTEGRKKFQYLEKQLVELKIKKGSLLDSYLSGDIFEKSNANRTQTIYPFGINLSQSEAIENAINNQVSVIQGPPGTGKTQSILNIIANCIVSGETVAVSSGNNKAVENIKEKLEKYELDFMVAFLGKSENVEFFFENQPMYPISMKSWKKSDEEMAVLLNEISKYEERIVTALKSINRVATLNELLFQYNHEYKYFKKYIYEKKTDLPSRLKIFSMDERKILRMINDIEKDDFNNPTILSRIKYFFYYGIYDIEQFKEKEKHILGLKESYYLQKIDSLMKEKIKHDKYIERVQFDQTLKLLETSSMEYLKSFISKKFSCPVRPIFDIKTYKKNFRDFVFEFPIVLGSTHAINRSRNTEFKFDYSIIDEASQVELVPGILSFNIAENAVVVGDLNQLPHIPTRKYESSIEEKYMVPSEYNYKQNSLLKSILLVYGDSISKVILKEHYRCHPRIIGFCNEKYYNGQLICHSKVENSKPMIVLKTSKGNHMRFGQNAVHKNTNLRELMSLIDDEFKDFSGIKLISDKTVGFMSPFRGQVNKSKELLSKDFQKDTVHRFQGRECDIMLLSTVLDSKANNNLFSFVDEARLINVAVSRAKEQFIITTDAEIFIQKNGEINDLIRYIEYYDENCIVESKVRSIFDLLYTDFANELERVSKKRGWGKSKFASESLMELLLNELIQEPNFNKYRFVTEVKLEELCTDYTILTHEEKTYIKNKARFDFVIYNKFDNQPVLAIEVDGYEFHENNPKQLVRDEVKDSISKKLGLNLYRSSTVGANERDKIIKHLI